MCRNAGEKLKKQLEDSWYIRKPMKEIWDDQAECRWQKKEVKSYRKLELAKNFYQIRFHGCGRMGVDKVRSISKEGSVYVDFATEQPIQNPTARAYTNSEIFLKLDKEDLSEYNRLSMWVYADAPGVSCNYLTIALHNVGPEIMPVPGRFEGSHSLMVESGKWQKVYWEFPHVARNCIVGVSINAEAYGTSVPLTNRIRIYYDDIQLEKVDADSDQGFALENRIAYCHSGYRNGVPKQALIQHETKKFSIIDEGGNRVYEGLPKEEKDFWLLDFSSVEKDGWYTIRTEQQESQPFPIGKEAYLSAAWKTLNFFFSERCGFDIPGIHTACHLDVMSVHPDGRKKLVAGGWHDAGDLTQDSKNTAESALAMLELGQQALDAGEKELGWRTLEEGRWGIDWLLQACGDRVVMTDLPGVREWLDTYAPGADVRYVTLPLMRNVDEAVPATLPDFERRIGQRIWEAVEAGETKKVDVSELSWTKIADAVLKA